MADILLYLVPSLALAFLIWLVTSLHPLFFVFSAAGTFCHELAHFSVGLLLGAEPTGFSIIPRRTGRTWELGSVTFANLRWYNAAPAALAPLLVLVVERMGAGGQVMTVEDIRNFPGHPEGISGFELGPLLQEEAEAAGAQFTLDAVLRLESSDGCHVLHGEQETIMARAVVVAAGSLRRKLQVPGEESLEGLGVSHCASCDGPLYRGLSVCVVGGGDSGFGEAQALAPHAAQVSVVFREAAPIASTERVEAVAALANVKLVPATEVIAVQGERNVSGVRVRDAGGREYEMPCDGVFVYAGLQPASSFLEGALELDEAGRIRTDDGFQTSRPGVFAAGDIRSGASWLLATAAEEGRAAGERAARWLKTG